ncbi:DUF2267 domain-containing protein [Arenibacterium sp. CAU 1754]
MSAYGLKIIDDAVHTTNAWLNDLDARIGWDHKQRSYRLLRSVMHVIRDHLSVDEAAQLAAQLPLLIRGIYYEGWNPSKTPAKERKSDGFIARVQADFVTDPLDDAPDLIAAVMAVLRAHVSGGEMNQVEATFSSEIREMFG